MHADQFETRLARVRHRFAATLESKITEAVVSADHMSRSSDGVIKHVSESYRHLHGICGIGPTVGFTATGAEGLHCSFVRQNGGPIVKNRTFFWVATEGYRSGTTRNEQELWPSLNQRSGDFSRTTSGGVLPSMR